MRTEDNDDLNQQPNNEAQYKSEDLAKEAPKNDSYQHREFFNEQKKNLLDHDEQFTEDAINETNEDDDFIYNFDDKL